MTSEFDTELYFAAGADGLKAGATVSLNTRYPLQPGQSELMVNGARLRLAPISLSIVAALAASAPLPIDALYEYFPHASPAVIRLAVLDLAQHEIVTIERCGALG